MNSSQPNILHKGLLFGAYAIISFLVGQFSSHSGFLGFVYIALYSVTPIILFKLTRNELSPIQLSQFSFLFKRSYLIYLIGSIAVSIVNYFYFSFIDKVFLITFIDSMVELLKDGGYPASMIAIIEEAHITPAMYSFGSLFSSIFSGLFLSILVALFARKRL